MSFNDVHSHIQEILEMLFAKTNTRVSRFEEVRTSFPACSLFVDVLLQVDRNLRHERAMQKQLNVIRMKVYVQIKFSDS